MNQAIERKRKWIHDDYREGFRQSIPIVVSLIPFGLLFGAVAVEHGFSLFQAMLMSVTIYAGASQLVGLQLFEHEIAPWLIVLSIFAVNFRHVLYSASVGRRILAFSFWQKAIAFFLLVDPQYAATEKRAETTSPITFAWYCGAAVSMYVSWIMATFVGALFGHFITDPHALGLDIILPIYFLGIVMGFRSRKSWLSVAATSGAVSVLAYKIVGSPWHISLGAIAGICIAALLAKPITLAE